MLQFHFAILRSYPCTPHASATLLPYHVRLIHMLVFFWSLSLHQKRYPHSSTWWGPAHLSNYNATVGTSMKWYWHLFAELVVTPLNFHCNSLYYIAHTCHMIIVLNCLHLNFPPKIIKPLKRGNVSDLFYTFCIYHNACHLGVGESVEWMNEYIL